CPCRECRSRTRRARSCPRPAGTRRARPNRRRCPETIAVHTADDAVGHRRRVEGVTGERVVRVAASGSAAATGRDATLRGRHEVDPVSRAQLLALTAARDAPPLEARAAVPRRVLALRAAARPEIGGASGAHPVADLLGVAGVPRGPAHGVAGGDLALGAARVREVAALRASDEPAGAAVAARIDGAAVLGAAVTGLRSRHHAVAAVVEGRGGGQVLDAARGEALQELRVVLEAARGERWRG